MINNKNNKINKLQNKLHNLINNFLNGNTLNKQSKLFYPFIDKNHNDFKEIIPLLKILNNTFDFNNSIKLIENSSHKKFLNYKHNLPTTLLFINFVL